LIDLFETIGSYNAQMKRTFQISQKKSK